MNTPHTPAQIKQLHREMIDRQIADSRTNSMNTPNLDAMLQRIPDWIRGNCAPGPKGKDKDANDLFIGSLAELSRLRSQRNALLEALKALTDRVDLVLYAGYVGHELIQQCRSAIAQTREGL